MFKAIVADDEEKVAKLICNLVDWEAMGIEIVGVAHDGEQALQLVHSHRPDIVVSDIRMPGYDGIELIRLTKEICPDTDFIIISGYKHFDYAYQAIKYGVEDYLLKPVKKDELTATLEKLIAKRKDNASQQDQAEQLRQHFRAGTERLKASLLSDLREGKMPVDLSIEQLNQEYHLSFQMGSFVMALIKMDFAFEQCNDNTYRLFSEKCARLLKRSLQEVCYDYSVFFLRSSAYLLLNFPPDDMALVRHRLKEVLDQLCALKDLFQDLNATIGLIPIENDFSNLCEAIHMVVQIVRERIVRGGGRILDSVPQDTERLVKEYLTIDTRRQISQAVDALDSLALRGHLEGLFDQAARSPSCTGAGMIELSHEILQVFLLSYQNHPELPLPEGPLQEVRERLEMCSSLSQVRRTVSSRLSSILSATAQEKKAEATRPIREAKKVIRQHYQEPLTLDQVASEVGLNATYLSALFKKETGTNFLEFLTETRIQQAKQLLVDTHKGVAEIAAQVGYSDLKHFTKLFKRIAGLTPSEYRKFYQ